MSRENYNHQWYLKNRERLLRESKAKYRAKNPVVKRQSAPVFTSTAEWRRYFRYGLSEEQYQKLLTLQNHCCAMCWEPFTRLKYPVVDHDHKTDEVRGLLHQACNRALGFFEKHGNNCERYLLYVFNRKQGTDAGSINSEANVESNNDETRASGTGDASGGDDQGRKVEGGRISSGLIQHEG